MNILQVKKDNPGSIDAFNEFFTSNSRNLFVLVHMNGCPPCIATLPKWRKMGDQLSKYDNSSTIPIVIADINADVVHSNAQISKHIKSIDGYPTIRYYKNSEFEANDVDRDVDGLVRWVKSKAHIDKVGGSVQKLFDQIKHMSTYKNGTKRIRRRQTVKRRQRRGKSTRQKTKNKKQKQKYKR